MLSRSAAFDTALGRSHRMASRVEVWTGPAASTSSTLLLSAIDITGGDVVKDSHNATRSTTTLEVIDRTGTLTPASAGDVLSPLTGNELRVYRGIVYPDATREMLLLGVFGIQLASVEDTAAGLKIKVSGSDRSRRVQRAALTDTYSISAGTNTATAIQALISSRVGGLTYSLAPTSTTLPATVYDVGSDPWAKALELAASIGCDLYFDAAGICTLAPVPDPTTQPIAWSYLDGQTSTLLNLTHEFTDAATFNDVIVSGQGSGVGPPVRARAQDTAPASPTYVLGPYGDVVLSISSSLVTTTAQAQTMATALLQRGIGQAESLKLDAIVNPAHEPGDAITVSRGKSKVAANYVIDAVTIPLAPGGSMPITARRRNT